MTTQVAQAFNWDEVSAQCSLTNSFVSPADLPLAKLWVSLSIAKLFKWKSGESETQFVSPILLVSYFIQKNTFITLFVTRALASFLKSWCVYNWGPAMYLTQLYYLSLIQTTSSTSVHPPTLSLSSPGCLSSPRLQWWSWSSSKSPSNCPWFRQLHPLVPPPMSV